MARAWLSSSLLPSKFWWYAMKRATEISNYLPIKIDNSYSAPFELAYGIKPNLKNLFPMFAVAYITRYHDGNITRKNVHSHSIRAIIVGRDPTSNACLFYHPGTPRTITSDEFVLDETLCAGPAFHLEYDGGLYFNKYSDYTDKIRPPLFTPDQTIYSTTTTPPLEGKTLTIPSSPIDRIYTVQFLDGSIHQVLEHYLTEVNPNLSIDNNNPPISTFPTWIKNISKATMLLPNESKPIRGLLIFKNNEYSFRYGRKDNNKIVPLPDFYSRAHTLQQSLKIFEGHPKDKSINKLRQQHNFSQAIANYICKHVSARGLTSENVPTLIQHKFRNANDKKIWDEAYSEEYQGLLDLPCWVTISEKQFQKERHKHIDVLPSMAVSTIKYDEHGKPKREKYRIVALGNFEKDRWSKSDCFAPVMSLLELRLLVALAVKNNRVLKNADIKQAFVQAHLPPEESYIIKPPPGCPLTPPNTYWKLLRTLYGLRRSPRHWFDKAAASLKSIGLEQSTHAPCLFHGHIIPNKPKLFLGMYVDDLIYFSSDPEVEKEFESELSELYTVDYMGKVSHFLGIKFQWNKKKHKTYVHLSQQAFAENLMKEHGLDSPTSTSKPTPFRSGLPVDSIIHNNTTPFDKHKIKTQLQSIVGSLLWLAQGTRPDLSVITSLLAQHQSDTNPNHVQAAKYVLRYIKGTIDLGVSFHTDHAVDIQSFIHFPISKLKVHAVTDANWEPQDQSVVPPRINTNELDLFLTRSISGYLTILHGPLYWSAKRQETTARSTAEAEIYHLSNIIKDLGLTKSLLAQTTPIFNDNSACIQWNNKKTSRNIRHIQIRENASREAVQNKKVSIHHISGKENPSDIFTKEQKDASHFLKLRAIILSKPFS